jgi:hypothetical protein
LQVLAEGQLPVVLLLYVDQMQCYGASVVVVAVAAKPAVVVAEQRTNHRSKSSHEHSRAVVEQVSHKLDHLGFVVDIVDW